jgi:nucleotide-binding universal stress UspA family protein
MLPVKTVLHPTDLSAASREAFGLACRIARDRGARVVALHVVPRLSQRSAEVVIGDPLARLREVAPDIAIDTRIESGDPAGVILRTAAETECDLIVMGTRGRTGLNRSRINHVSHEVVERATCPVLTMRYSSPDDGWPTDDVSDRTAPFWQV